MTAFANGEKIQVQSCAEFQDYHGQNPNFENDNLSWRIKPKPREWWLCAPCKNIDVVNSPYAVWTIHPGTTNNYAEVIHVREVL